MLAPGGLAFSPFALLARRPTLCGVALPAPCLPDDDAGRSCGALAVRLSHPLGGGLLLVGGPLLRQRGKGQEAGVRLEFGLVTGQELPGIRRLGPVPTVPAAAAITAVTAIAGGRSESEVWVCDLVFLSRCMRPEGPWQRLRRCLAQRR